MPEKKQLMSTSGQARISHYYVENGFSCGLMLVLFMNQSIAALE